MPNINVYLNEKEYFKLVVIAQKNGKRASQLAREILSKHLTESEAQ
jgi:hypothetical protein